MAARPAAPRCRSARPPPPSPAQRGCWAGGRCCEHTAALRCCRRHALRVRRSGERGDERRADLWSSRGCPAHRQRLWQLPRALGGNPAPSPPQPPPFTPPHPPVMLASSACEGSTRRTTASEPHSSWLPLSTPPACSRGYSAWLRHCMPMHCRQADRRSKRLLLLLRRRLHAATTTSATPHLIRRLCLLADVKPVLARQQLQLPRRIRAVAAVCGAIAAGICDIAGAQRLQHHRLGLSQAGALQGRHHHTALRNSQASSRSAAGSATLA